MDRKVDGDITLQRRWYEMKIKNKMNLRKVLHDGNFNCIVVWQDGIWTDCEKRSVEDSIYGIRIRHSNFHDVTHKQITERFMEIEATLSEKIEA